MSPQQKSKGFGTMVTGSTEIKAWLIDNDGAEPENDPTPFLIGPIMQTRPGKDHRYLIEYNSDAFGSQVSTAVCMPNGDLVFSGDDISTASFTTFEELEAWLAENKAPLTSTWFELKEVDIEEDTDAPDYDADGNVITY